MPGERVSSAVALSRGLTRRCARCGSGRLFDGWFRMKKCCPRCSLDFERDNDFFLGAFTILFVTTLALLALVLFAGFAATAPDPPLLALALGAAGAMILFPLAFFPFSRTVWLAFDLLFHDAARTSSSGFRRRG